MYIYIYIYTYIAQGSGYIYLYIYSPGVGMRHLEGPKNPDRLNFGTYIFVCVQNTHVCVYARRRDDIWTNCIFL